ncbi:hypothetical protein [Leptospira fainei]|nr:hypothetical protein [Leptospira fainei]
MSEPDDVLFRGIDINASPERVFPWLCQLRVAPYSYDWIDNKGKRSPRTLDPELQKLSIGQKFIIFKLASFKKNEHITLITYTRKVENFFGKIAMTYLVQEISTGSSRLLVKMLVKRSGRKLLAALLPWGDWVMMRKQLLTLKELSETFV